MTDITNFSDVRVGSTWPMCFDIQPITSHEAYGIFALTYNSGLDRFIQLRQIKDYVALFHFSHESQKLPDMWKDSIVLWDSRQK